MSEKSPSRPLRCRLLGHKFHYKELEGEKVVLEATCIRRGCEYFKRLTEDDV